MFYPDEINRMTRTKAVYEAKAQKLKYNEPELSNLYKKSVNSLDDVIKYLKVRNKQKELEAIKEKLS